MIKLVIDIYEGTSPDGLNKGVCVDVSGGIPEGTKPSMKEMQMGMLLRNIVTTTIETVKNGVGTTNTGDGITDTGKSFGAIGLN